MMRWLDKIPVPLLLALTLLIGLAPFVPEPHVVEKTRLLLQGNLTRPLDIFDLFYHGAPVVLLVLKIYRTVRAASRAGRKIQ